MSQFERNLPSKKGKGSAASSSSTSGTSGNKNAMRATQNETATRQGSGGKPSVPPSMPPQKNRGPKKKKKRIIRVVLIVLLCLVVLVVGALAFVYNSIRVEIAPEEGGYTPEDIGSIPEYTGEGVTNFLVCGLDYDNEEADGYTTEEHIGRTDMILYVRYDTINNKVVLMQIPRDVYVGPELETGGTGKINGLYYYAEDPNNRMEPLSRAIYDQLGLPVDFYVTLDMDALKEIIDHPPGYISVYVPMDVIDPNNPEAMIPAGWRDFTSDEAEFFLRNRTSPTYEGMSDIMRLQMQQSFYSALYREFTELTPTDLLMWMRVLLYRVNTDMDPVQLGGLAQNALSLESSDITFIRPPVGAAMYGNNSVLSLEAEGTADLMNEYLRPEGQSLGVEDLNIYTLPMNLGVSEASIRSMTDIQAVETTDPAAEQTAETVVESDAA